jgi:hypothetical protein
MEVVLAGRKQVLYNGIVKLQAAVHMIDHKEKRTKLWQSIR